MSNAAAGIPDFPGLWRPNTQSSVPLFDQLRSHILELSDAGSLPPGTRLPAVRALAAEIGVAPHTVARAYKELEEAGVVETRGRHGTVLRARDDRTERLRAGATQFALLAKSNGLNFAEAVQILGGVYGD
ncbi:GntR family transcriptional regulator [Pseudarthrobacter sp. J1738]|uniref:GntR family transcriptional regulator n=1 Tax=unclassified Pseudarthrobacter TaxID=2647000 RepID=UPI003D29F921